MVHKHLLGYFLRLTHHATPFSGYHILSRFLRILIDYKTNTNSLRTHDTYKCFTTSPQWIDVIPSFLHVLFQLDGVQFNMLPLNLNSKRNIIPMLNSFTLASMDL
jgi:hypothetical protein